MDKLKVTVIAALSALMSWLGILAVPVFLLLGCNVIDYITGLDAAKYRSQSVESEKSFKGIKKKVLMYLLIVLGVFVDILLEFTLTHLGIGITLPFVVATVVAVWLVVNEIISILENMIDIGMELPPFLLPLVKNIKKQVEKKSNSESEE